MGIRGTVNVDIFVKYIFLRRDLDARKFDMGGTTFVSTNRTNRQMCAKI